MDQRPPSTEGATPVDDGTFIDMTRVLGNAPMEAPEEPASAVPGPSAPLTRTERLLASMASEKDKAEAELRIIEDQIIQAEVIAEETERQARAEYEADLAAAKAKLDRVLGRMTEDKEANMLALEASKADVLGIVAMFSGGIEAAANGGAK